MVQNQSFVLLTWTWTKLNNFQNRNQNKTSKQKNYESFLAKSSTNPNQIYKVPIFSVLNIAIVGDIGSAVISGVGQSDDVMLLSNDIYSLKLLVKLTEEY